MFTKKHLLVLCLAALIILASMSLAYGAWTETLTVKNTVHTGTLNTDFASMSASDTSIYADCSVVNSATNEITVTISGAFPGYACTISGGIHNYGTVAAKMTGETHTGNLFDVAGLTMDFSDPAFLSIAPGAEPSGSMTITFNNGTGEPAQDTDYTGTITIGVTQAQP